MERERERERERDASFGLNGHHSVILFEKETT
jgi:hypothetical protein